MDGENSLGQIRDLLVGPQIQSIENRLNEIHDRIDRELHALRGEVSDRSSSLESTIRDELRGLRQQVERNHAEHHASSQNLAAETAELLTHLNQTSNAFEEQLGHNDREIRRVISDRIESLERELNARRDGLRYELVELIERMQHDKMDRTMISRLFREVAGSIEDSSEAPVEVDHPSHS